VTAADVPSEHLILVVDDESSILRAVSGGLDARGYRVTTASDGRSALAEIARRSFDLVVLDLGLPDVDGVEVCRRVRTWSEVPIVILSAEGSEERKILALDEGADDYVTKPFSMPELLARIRVALRHRKPRPGTADEGAIWTIGDLVVDAASRTVVAAGREVILTRKEFDFLALLARHAGRVLTHHAILAAVWGPGYGTELQYLRVYASRIRRKIGDDPARPHLLTAPGIGYRLVDPNEGADLEES
jgi:two-component system KDP operon response regulator KdpE